MERLLAPDALRDGNLAEGWKKFKREFTQFLEATEKTNADSKVKVAILLRVIGDRGNDIYENFKLSATNKLDYTKVIAEFDKFCEPQHEVFISRHRLLCMKQEGMPIEEFETKLRTQARNCNLGDLTDDLTCHAFVEGVDDKKLRDKLLMKAIEGGLTLTTAIKLGREFTAAQEHMKEVSNSGAESVNKLYVKTHYQPKRDQEETISQGRKEAECNFCGRRHRKGPTNCPAYGKQCNYCKKVNHFEKKCMKRSKDIEDGVACVGISEAREGHEELLSITVAKSGKKLITDLQLSNSDRTLRCQLDSAAAKNIITREEHRRLGSPKLKPSQVTLITYDGTMMPSLGKLDLQFKGLSGVVEFEVANPRVAQMPIIGVDTCLEQGLLNINAEVKAVGQVIDREWILENYGEVFTGLGEMPGEYEIRIDPDIPPVQHRPRRTPVMLKDDIIAKVKELERAGVISRVDEPTDWISSLVAFRKPNGKIRPCLDPKDLNQAIIRNHYPTPTLDDVLPKLSKAKCFSLLDAKDGFLQVKLAEQSRKLTTFWTPLGRYCWNRLPFGLSSAPEEYQRRLHMLLDGLDGIEVIADDILIYGIGDDAVEARRDHDQKLIALLDRLRQKGVKINKDKMKLHLPEIKYMGHILTAEGIKPDPAKVQGLHNMPYPTDQQAVKRFLGTVNYLAKFLPHLSDKAEPLRNVKEGTGFLFGQPEKDAWDEIIEMISEDTLLRYFDPRKPVVIECDASTKGLGAVMIQDGKPVCFASRTLSATETKYHPLELECLAVVFGCTKFDQYIYGKKDLTVLSDHRPLETILKKEMDKSPLRLQKMLLYLQRYGFDLQYKPGSQQVVADMLSRAPVSSAMNEKETWSKCEVFLMETSPTEYTDMTDRRLERMRQLGSMDPGYQQLIKMVTQGWPGRRASCDALVSNYWTFQEELAVQDGLVYRGTRLVVPLNMVREICDALHGSHQSAESMMRRARDILYWPNMAPDLQMTAETCQACQMTKPKNQRETIRMHDVPVRPFEKVGTDICYHKGRPYLIVVDYMSDYIDVEKLEDERAATVIEGCKVIFARHGVPLWVHSDNATYYTSYEFQKFSEDWKFRHTTSSPTHSQSNGKAESAVKIIKRLLKTSKEPWMALLEWRASPNRDFPSPAERLYSRKLRTSVPMAQECYDPNPIAEDVVAEARLSRQHRIASTYNKRSRDLAPLKTGQPVLLETVNDRAQKWRQATVLEKLSDRSYLVENDQGNIVRRNRRSIQAPSTDNGCQRNDIGLAPEVNGAPEVRQEMQSPPVTTSTTPVKTRFGRVVRKPSYLKDYEQ